MNIGLKTAMIQDLNKLGYEVSNYDKKIIDTIVTLYQQIKDCDKELKKEGLLIEVDGKIKSNPRLDVKLKLLSTLKGYLAMFPLDIKTKMTILVENEIDEEVYGTDDTFADSLVLEM
ncbi:MAG: P27 family phage terminase small subunit [Terrisporobacter othiniensis]|uniref:P27 family phage terminase small subunit n=1 Tax=Terrisporobacter othiniensis TaxID=1577792 RepID=UPI002A74B4A7|nr:P27 family phage terminase small subunit [Terrisporobacter othiniensis]MDY3372060.1 P27 family phage terminase small subunit [Terrisporobacter othiniensis]